MLKLPTITDTWSLSLSDLLTLLLCGCITLQGVKNGQLENDGTSVAHIAKELGDTETIEEVIGSPAEVNREWLELLFGDEYQIVSKDEMTLTIRVSSRTSQDHLRQLLSLERQVFDASGIKQQPIQPHQLKLIVDTDTKAVSMRGK